MADLTRIQEHMEVVGSDGQHLGRIDHVEADGSLKLTRQDPAAGGVHHIVPSSMVAGVEGDRVTLNCTAEKARSSWRQARET
jgi:hypothetical protein